MTQIINNNCDGQGVENCTAEDSEVRVLPFGNGNLILCRNHYNKEIQFRKDENFHKFQPFIYWQDETTLRNFPNPSRYEIPMWTTLKIYTGE
jgi:hypothetical protein